MNEAISKKSGWSLYKDKRLLILAVIVFCLTLSILYSLEILSLELVFMVSILPFLPCLLLLHQEVLLLALVATYFGATYFSSSLLIEGLIRGLFLFIIGLVLLLKLGAKKAITRISTPLDKIIFLWLVIVLLSFIYGFYFKHNETRYLIGDLYKFVEIFLVFWLTTFIVKNDRQIRFLIWGFFVVALVFGGIDSIIFFRRFYLVGSALLARVRAAAQFSSIFALILGICLILHERRIIVRAVLMFLSLGFLVSFLLTFLRTGYIVLPATLAFVILLYLYKKRRYPWAGIMKFVIFGIFLLISVGLFNVILASIYPGMDIIKSTSVRFSSLIDPVGADPMGVRMLEINSIISGVIAASPFLGNGLGGEYYSATLVNGELQWGMKHFVHNNYFDFLVRTGTLGLIVFLVFVFIYLRNSIKFYLRSSSDSHQGVLLGTTGIFVSSCLIALSTSPIYSPFLFMMVALTYCVTYLEEKRALRKPKVE
jgi:O-antigen ligase